MACEEFIIAELTRRGVEYHLDRKNVYVSCPFHVHSGVKRKLGFKRDSIQGAMHCWVCRAHGTWNDYAKHMGFETIDYRSAEASGDTLLLERELEEAFSNKKEISFPKGAERWEGSWRGLSDSFLRTVPSFKWYDETSKGDRILWPVVMRSKLMGCTTARANPSDTSVRPKTRNLAGMNTQFCLFPFDHFLIKDRVVLVEGQYDALRLLANDIPALCIFGTGNWMYDKNGKESGNIKANLLASRGIKNVVIAMDGDDEGWSAAREIYKTLKHGFDVKVMEFPDPPAGEVDESGNKITAYDPGNCPVKYLKVIKKLLA